MSFLSSVWAWLGTNAGQVQIVIALVAIFLAILAYLKALHQTKFALDSIQTARIQLQVSLDQSKIELQNRFLDKKNEVLKITTESIQKIDGAILEIETIRLHFIQATSTRVSSKSNLSSNNLKGFEDLTVVYEQMLEFRDTLKSMKEKSNKTFNEILALTQEDSDRLEEITLSVLTEKVKQIEALGVVHYDKLKIDFLLPKLN